MDHTSLEGLTELQIRKMYPNLIDEVGTWDICDCCLGSFIIDDMIETKEDELLCVNCISYT